MDPRPKNVIIVEDDRLLSLVATRLVEKIGHSVVATADNGLDALSKIRDHHPDIILMDIRIKGEMNGIETTEKIKQEFSIPVVYLSGSSDVKNYDRAEIIGYEGFLQKPLQAQELKKVFRKVFSSSSVPSSPRKGSKVVS